MANSKGIHNPEINRRDREVAKAVMDNLDLRSGFRSEDRALILENLCTYRSEIVEKAKKEFLPTDLGEVGSKAYAKLIKTMTADEASNMLFAVSRWMELAKMPNQAQTLSFMSREIDDITEGEGDLTASGVNERLL